MMLFDQHLQAAPSTSSMPATTTVEGHPLPVDPHPFHQAHGAAPAAPAAPAALSTAAAAPFRRKRKADPQDAPNERLSKRMSLLNLEHNGPKLYVPVEQPQVPQQTLVQPAAYNAPTTADSNDVATIAEEEPMNLDDTSHKVYIYNLDDELSSDNESDIEDRDREGRLVFLPDIEKHLRANRLPFVPRPILPNKDGELAGMQLVLYSDGPSSLTVPEEQDSVRKAILEARARVRQKQAEERGAGSGLLSAAAVKSSAGPSRTGKVSFATPVRVLRPEVAYAADMMVDGQAGGQSSSSAENAAPEEYDPDAMDID